MEENTNQEETTDTTVTCTCGAIIYQNELCDCKKTEEYKNQVKINQNDTTSTPGIRQS